MRRLAMVILLASWAAAAAAQERAEPPKPKPPALAIISPAVAVPGSDAAALPRKAAPLAELLTKLGETFADLTSGASGGKFEPGEARVVMVGAGALSDQEGRVARSLWENRKAVAEFVESGGVLVVFTTPGDAGALAFLPGVTQASIEELSHDERVVTVAEHPLVAGRHKLSARDLGTRPPRAAALAEAAPSRWTQGAEAARGTLYPGGCYGVYLGLAPVVALDARGRYPIVLEGAAGRGRVILVHLAPDRAFLFGSDDEKVGATLLMENVVRWARAAAAGEWPAPAVVDRSVRGTVFEDANANGVFDAGERALAGLDVSDGAALARTDADGKFYLPMDAYSEFVWCGADLATHRGPFWRRISSAGSLADIALVPRAKPLAATRIVHLVDAGALVDPTSKDDPEMSWTLGEVARIAPAPDVLVIAGDAACARLAAARPQADAPPAETLRVFAGGRGRSDSIGVAERDAFAGAFGPTAYVVRLAGRELAVTAPRLIEGRLPGRLATPGAGRVDFEGGLFKTAGATGATPSFRLRGVATPPTATILDLAAGGARAESRLLGLTKLLHAVHPGLESVVAPGPLRPIVIVGDTAGGSDVPLKLDLARVERRGDRLEIVQAIPQKTTVVPVGRLTRAVEYQPPVPLGAGYHILRLSAGWPDGKSPTRHVTYAVPVELPPVPALGEPWRMTGVTESRSGVSSADAAVPPLRLSGAAHGGSVVPGESPVVLSDVIMVHGAPSGAFAEVPAFPGLPVMVRRLDVPSVCHAQGRYELRGDHAALVTGPVLRFNFGADRPGTATSHLVVGGDVLCAVDARGEAWGFARARGAEVKEGAYDRKIAADSLRWKTDILPGCRRAATTPLELFTGAECIELGSGRIRWSWEKYALRERTVAISPDRSGLVAAGVTTTAPTRQMVVCFDADTGRVAWEKTLAEVHPLDDACTPTPSLYKGMLFIGSADGVMRALRLSDGAEIWSFRTGESVLPLGPTAARTGRITSQAAVTEACVFFGACDGRVYALDRRKGTPLWSYNLGLPVVSSPALSGNTLVVADWDANVYAFTSLAVKKSRKSP